MVHHSLHSIPEADDMDDINSDDGFLDDESSAEVIKVIRWLTSIAGWHSASLIILHAQNTGNLFPDILTYRMGYFPVPSCDTHSAAGLEFLREFTDEFPEFDPLRVQETAFHKAKCHVEAQLMAYSIDWRSTQNHAKLSVSFSFL